MFLDPVTGALFHITKLTQKPLRNHSVKKKAYCRDLSFVVFNIISKIYM